MIAAIPFPDISPMVFSVQLGPFDLGLRWYALGYIAGINKAQLEVLVTWMALGIILGGRLGFVLFYQPGYYLSHPVDILKVWQGGMSFHGGFAGVVLAALAFCRKHGVSAWHMADLLALAAPPGILMVRITNFINAELWGRPTDVPWGVIFPDVAAQTCPGFAPPCARHPSQLYEAGLEGLLLGALILILAFGLRATRRPGLLAGTFFLGYGLARFIVEFFRNPDAQFISETNPDGHVFAGMTMGQLLSTPMIAAGLIFLFLALRRSKGRAV